jgi:hypothetical protein
MGFIIFLLLSRIVTPPPLGFQTESFFAPQLLLPPARDGVAFMTEKDRFYMFLERRGVDYNL